MLKYAMVGVAGVLAGGLATWVLRPTPEARQERVTEPTRTARAPRSVPRDEPVDDAAFAECKRALVQQRAELRLVREEAARAGDERTRVSVDDEDGPPLDEPSGRSTSTSAQQEGGAAAEPQSERERRRQASAKVGDAVLEHLEITDDEQRVMKDLLCPQQDNLRGLYSDFAQGLMSTDDFFQALTQERAVSAEGLQRALGKRRYRQMRRVGALGLLTPRLCKRR